MRPNFIKRLLLFCAVAAVALILPAGAVADPMIDVIPSAYDFGEVEVGSSEATALLVTNFNGHDLVVYDISFSAGSSADFALDIPELPRVVPPLSYLYLDATYAPTAEGCVGAVLEIRSNDAARPVVTVDLGGTGVAATPSPVDDLLTSFDDWVTDGTLVGSGSGNSADGRLGALRNMIAQAGTYLDQGDYALAVAQLEAVLARCDGAAPPPDFVAGDAAAELHGLVEELVAALEG